MPGLEPASTSLTMSPPEAIATKIAPPRRVLIVLLGAIGDVVRALPLLGRIRKAWPDAHIAWAVEPKSRAVLEHHRWLDEIIVYDRAHAPWTFLPFLRRVRKGHFDLAIDLQRHLKSGLTARVSGAGDRFGFAAPNTKEFNYLFSNHQIEPQPNMRLKLLQYQAFGDALGLAPSAVEFGLAATDGERARAIEMLRDFRILPEQIDERFLLLQRFARNLRHQVVRALAPKMRRQRHHHRFRCDQAAGHGEVFAHPLLIDMQSVSQVARVMQRARGGEENFRRRRMRVFLQEMMLGRPYVIEAEAVGELDLLERILEELVFRIVSPWTRELMLIETANLHSHLGTSALS